MKYGFTLIELAIVLIILGLLAGGVLYGQNLIRAAELRSVISDYERFTAAVYTFKNKYFYLPGDIPNATKFWGSMTNCGSGSPSGAGTETCDGNGDGNIDAPVAAEQTGESFAFWQQLSNVGLIEGRYTGIAGSNHALDAIIGENAPASNIGNAGWEVAHDPDSPGNSFAYAYDYQNRFAFGGYTVNTMTGRVLTPDELWNIDSKVDDGLPTSGQIIAIHWGNAASENKCTFGSSDETDLTANYNLTNNDISCAFYVINVF